MPIKPADPALVDKVVIANRILYDQGVVDGLGHVSVRHDSEPDVFLLSCNRAPAMVRRPDITCYDLDGTPYRTRPSAVISNDSSMPRSIGRDPM